MTTYLDDYRAIIADLDPSDVTALWYAALSGHRVDPGLRDRLAALVALRDRMGQASMLRRSQRAL